MKNITVRSSFPWSRVVLVIPWHWMEGYYQTNSLKRINKEIIWKTSQKIKIQILSMRRGFLKAATLLGLGTVAAGTVKGYAVASQSPKRKKA